MPGAGVAPKHPDQRRNRNPKRQGDWIVLPKEGRQEPPPPTDGYGFSKQTIEWWNLVWKSPQATQWTEDDIPALIELGLLRERLLDGKISVAPEVRQRTDQFGLTPAGRQRLRWVITEGDAVRAGVADEVELQRNRRRLSAVDPDALARG